MAIFDGNRRLSLKPCKTGQVTIRNLFFIVFREKDYTAMPTHFFNFV